jgi:hypothetical protein
MREKRICNVRFKNLHFIDKLALTKTSFDREVGVRAHSTGKFTPVRQAEEFT